MKATLPVAWIFLLLTFPLLADDSKLPPPAQIQVDFKQHVRPILEQKCYCLPWTKAAAVGPTTGRSAASFAWRRLWSSHHSRQKR